MITHCKRNHEFTEENTYVTPRDGFRVCKQCRRLARNSYYANNRTQHAARNSDWKSKNPEYGQEWERTHRVSRQGIRRKSKYQITKDEYAQMLESQHGSCKICKTEMKTICIDHCHETGKVRGLLCRKCNTGIGMLQDNLDIVQNAAEYLACHSVL